MPAEGLTEHFINQQRHFVGVNQNWKHPPPPWASCVTKPFRTLLVSRCKCYELMINTLAHEMDWGLNGHIFFKRWGPLPSSRVLNLILFPFTKGHMHEHTHHTMSRCVVRGKGLVGTLLLTLSRRLLGLFLPFPSWLRPTDRKRPQLPLADQKAAALCPHRWPTSCSWIISASMLLSFFSFSLACARISSREARVSSSSRMQSFIWACVQERLPCSATSHLLCPLQSSLQGPCPQMGISLSLAPC